MAQFPGITLTNAGLNMIAESQASSTALIFTNLKMGDGTVSSGEDIKTLTAVKNPLLTVPIESHTNQGDGQVKLRFAISNGTLATGFFARELGIYAKIGESGTEQLYAYTNAGNLTDYIPDKNTPIDEQIIDIYLVVGNASSVEVVTDGSIMYVTSAELADHNTNTSAHADLLNLRKNGTPYVVGECKQSAKLLSYEYLECTVGGTTGVTEPTYPAVGNTVVDGAVTWIVRDKRQADAQFDVGTKLATTAFVKNVGFQYSGVIGLTASRNALATDIGNSIFVANAGLTYTLLTPNALIGSQGAGGKTITFTTTSYGVTLVAGSGVTLCLENGTVVSTMQVPVGVTITLYSGNGVQWRAIGGSGALAGSGVFAASLAPNGYQKLPSGLILQWGGVSTTAGDVSTRLTFPIVFPNACLIAYASAGNYQPGATSTEKVTGGAAFSWDRTGMSVASQSSVIRSLTWLAIGY